MSELEVKRGKFRIRASTSKITLGTHIIEKLTGGIHPSRLGSMTSEDLHDLREAISDYLLHLSKSN